MKPYYQDETVTIYNADCRELLPHLSVDAIVTDPPYGTEALGGGYGRSHTTISNDQDLEVPLQALELAAQCLAPKGWLACFYASGGNRRRTIEDQLLAAGFVLVGEAVWDKGRPGLGFKIRYAHEAIIIAANGEPDKPPAALLSVLRGQRTEANMANRHPHEKPVAVMGSLVQFTTPAGGTVLDPFMGTGATLRAAKDLGIQAIGIELEERYCEWAAQRMAQQTLF